MDARDQAEYEKLREAAEKVWGWVGPGYPDLDDLQERELFMNDVSALAATYFFGERQRVEH